MQFALATGGALLIGALYIILPPQLQVVPYWVVLALEGVVLAPIVIALASERVALTHRVRRGLAFALLAVVTLALVSSVIALVLQLPSFNGGGQLLRAGVAIWVMNVLVFSVWYWETDGGGPAMRHRHGHRAVDFQFPQQMGGDPGRWKPGFVDYLFLAFCSATALSPADTMPLSRPAKLLMMAEALISVVVLVVLVGRSVNII